MRVLQESKDQKSLIYSKHEGNIETAIIFTQQYTQDDVQANYISRHS